MGSTAIPICKESERVKREHLGDQVMQSIDYAQTNFESHMSVHLQERHFVETRDLNIMNFNTNTNISVFSHECKEMLDKKFSETDSFYFHHVSFQRIPEKKPL